MAQFRGEKANSLFYREIPSYLIKFIEELESALDKIQPGVFTLECIDYHIVMPLSSTGIFIRITYMPQCTNGKIAEIVLRKNGQLFGDDRTGYGHLNNHPCFKEFYSIDEIVDEIEGLYDFYVPGG